MKKGISIILILFSAFIVIAQTRFFVAPKGTTSGFNCYFTDTIVEYSIKDVDSISFLISRNVSGSVDGHDYVDLGLPSGTLWATCDIGADSIYNSGTGLYWCTKSLPAIGDHISDLRSKGVIGKDSILTSKYDHATSKWGKNWKTPTKEQFEELKKYCRFSDFTIWCKKVTGPNGNTLFLQSSNTVGYGGYIGHYWTSTAYEYYNNNNAKLTGIWSFRICISCSYSYGKYTYPQLIETTSTREEYYIRPVVVY